MNILVTGSKGQLGREFQDLEVEYKDYRFRFTDKDDLDITSADALAGYFKQNTIDCVINCSGYTSVDAAEENVEAAKLLNARAVGQLAEASASVNALLVHISTDYVFDGKSSRPYTENNPANPRSVYGKSKLDGELEVILNAKRSVIIRTSWLYSPYGQNFMKTVLSKVKQEKSLNVVFDQVGTPTYAADLAKTILDILPRLPEKIRGEIYNYSNEGACSWYDFAHAIIEIEGLYCKLSPVLSKELKTAASRPHYSVLDKSRIKKAFGLEIPYWRDSLKRCLERL